MRQQQKRKIVIVASYPDSLLNFRLHLIQAFLKCHFAVVLIAPYDEKVMAYFSELNVKYIPIALDRNGNNPFADLALLYKLYQLMRKEQPDYVFSYTIKPVIYGTLSAKLASVSHIYAMLTGTGYIFFKRNLKNRIVGWIARNMFRFSLRFNKKLFFQNKDNLASFLAHKLITKKQPVAIINGSGVDITHFSPAPLPTALSFLMIARLLYDKGVREYVAAARIIKKKYPQVIFKLVGWIDTNPNSVTSEELCAWTKEGVIEYLGKLSDVRPVIADTSVYVLPSYGEGTPRTVLEAMAMGRPIITTDVAGCRETVEEGVNGFMVPAFTIEPLANAMEYFILHPEKIKTMGEESRRIAVEKYDVHKVNHIMLSEMEAFP